MPHPARFNDLTVAMIAKDAEATIAEAVQSMRDRPARFLLVDSSSRDNTVSAAQNSLSESVPMDLITLPYEAGVGAARQAAVEAIETDYALWLDADDILLPGHMQAMHDALSAGADICFAGATLLGQDLSPITDTPIPDFLRQPGGLAWCFERNWLPSLHAGFKADAARRIGYNPALFGAEDYDFLLRALLEGAAIELFPGTSYGLRHTPTSLSRNLDLMTTNTRKVVENLYAHYPDLVAWLRERVPADMLDWFFTAHFMTMEGWEGAIECALNAAPSNRLHPVYGSSLDELQRFARATACLLIERPSFAQFAGLPDHPACLNNQAVAALKENQENIAARVLLDTALTAMPGYIDAQHNRDLVEEDTPPDFEALRITRMPLRTNKGRNDYSPLKVEGSGSDQTKTLH